MPFRQFHLVSTISFLTYLIPTCSCKLISRRRQVRFLLVRTMWKSKANCWTIKQYFYTPCRIMHQCLCSCTKPVVILWTTCVMHLNLLPLWDTIFHPYHFRGPQKEELYLLLFTSIHLGIYLPYYLILISITCKLVSRSGQVWFLPETKKYNSSSIHLSRMMHQSYIAVHNLWSIIAKVNVRCVESHCHHRKS